MRGLAVMRLSKCIAKRWLEIVVSISLARFGYSIFENGEIKSLKYGDIYYGDHYELLGVAIMLISFLFFAVVASDVYHRCIQNKGRD
jgi:hypothetical protein